MAVTIGAVLIVLASTLFLVQNEFYSQARRRAEVQENARSVVELIASEARSVVPGGVVLADSTRLVLRSPSSLAVVCAFSGSNYMVHAPAAADALDTANVSGVGLFDEDATSWSFTSAGWSNIYSGSGSPKDDCATAGADTVGGAGEFLSFADLGSLTGATVELGDVLMLYRELEYSFQASALDTTAMALYRGPYGGTLTEYATGLTGDAHFQYRRGDTTHYTSIPPGWLDDVDGLRIVAEAEALREGGAQADIVFGLTVRTALRNAR